MESFAFVAPRTWHGWFLVWLYDFYSAPGEQSKIHVMLFVTEISARGAEDRTNGDFLIGTTCYFCWVLRHTCACARAHTKTHNLRNVSRRFECQGFPLCWPAVRAAAGCGCVAVCKETQRTTWQVLFFFTAEKLFVFVMCINQTYNVTHVTY